MLLHYEFQTTYENFRYQYDNKENPFNKGILGNFKEVFLSKIPPSMIKFRAWTSEDDDHLSSVMDDTGKDNFDIEMGVGATIPNLLQKRIDYSGFDDPHISSSISQNSTLL